MSPSDLVHEATRLFAAQADPTNHYTIGYVDNLWLMEDRLRRWDRRRRVIGGMEVTVCTSFPSPS